VADRPVSVSVLDEADDSTLIAALSTGDSRAPGVLWRRFAPMVFRMLRRMLGSRHEVEDLAQEVFLCAYSKAPELRNPEALRAFIMSTTVFLARGELRRISSRHHVAGHARTLPLERQSGAERADAREALRRFYRIVERIRAADRVAFVLRFIEGMALREVAVATGTSLATTKRRLARSWAKVALLVQRDPVLSQYGRAA
jgi:RNA polymerase sigma-70 factor, ECF subfamily